VAAGGNANEPGDVGGSSGALAEKTGSKVIAADATLMEDLEALIDQAQELLGGKLDFVLHSIGMSVNVRKGKHYTDLNHDWMAKGWDVSAVSFHKLMQCLYKKDAMNEWGSIVALSYVAAQRTFPNYNDMADNKAYLESIARSFGYFFGKDKKSSCKYDFTISDFNYSWKRCCWARWVFEVC